MRKIDDKLWVGDDTDADIAKQLNMYIIHAAKYPWHKDLCGYDKALPSDHPDYYYKENDKELALNLVDANDPSYIPDIIIEKALNAIELSDVSLVHCNKGTSRSPTIALLYLARKGRFKNMTFEEAETEFRRIYPMYLPRNGMRMYAKMNWEKYNK